MVTLVQTPAPGLRRAVFCGDTIKFELKLSQPLAGAAWLRTNLGRGAVRRREIIQAVHSRRRAPACDWRDMPMQRVNATTWQITLPLLESGHFEAKAFFMPAEEVIPPLWPEGANVVLNVHPASAACATLVYNAFVRQFGRHADPGSLLSQADQAQLTAAGYTIIPPSGTFRDLRRELDFIIGRLGCRVLMLLPIHPTPTVFARMGTYGSPYAALDFFDVDPALAEFDPRCTPLDQFQELVDAVHAREAKIWLDIAINHTGWASKIHAWHPEWLARAPDGRIRSPGAWGTVWEDLTELNHQEHQLWDYLARVFLFWCSRGVDGFRCDAAYMIPVETWEYLVARVRSQFPETFFLLEGLGGKIETTAALMDRANLNGAYSELFQNYDRAALENYLPLSNRLAEENGLMVHFAETHDNNRLAARSHAWARMRTALSALCSVNGAFAFANGVEWLATEKIDVHGRASLNWGASDNQVDWIRRLQQLLRTHPAFFPQARCHCVPVNSAHTLAYLRQPENSEEGLLALINLDDRQPDTVVWPRAEFDGLAGPLVDLLSGEKITRISEEGKKNCRIQLAPAEVLCLSRSPAALEQLDAAARYPLRTPKRILQQRLRAKVWEILSWFKGFGDISNYQADALAEALSKNPAEFCRSFMPGQANCVTNWQPVRDEQRFVMVPHGHFVLTVSATPFRLRLLRSKRVIYQEDALPLQNGKFFTLVPPQSSPCRRLCRMEADMYAADPVQHVGGTIIFLPPAEHWEIPACLTENFVMDRRVCLSVNGRGGMMRTAIDWGKIYSRYDALLAANLDERHPVDRRVLFTRCRAWLEYHGYSRELDADTLQSFTRLENAGLWRFCASFGDAGHVVVELCAGMLPELNAVELTFRRIAAGGRENMLADQQPVTLILRPDIEDRNFHEDTLAYAGPEKQWPGAVAPTENGFVFAPAPERRLELRISAGAFHSAPEWQYMVYHPVEAERGLRAHSDLFSPGYFRAVLVPEQPVRLTAAVPAVSIASGTTLTSAQTPNNSLEAVLATALRQFLARRGTMKTVIAGYPWFLDWGRDTLICARGLIAAGLFDEAQKIILQFATFEKQGTLPNVLSGAAEANRDTSDAPLWLAIACADWCRATGSQTILSAKAGTRTLKSVLVSILDAYRQGTPNGIIMDKESSLIFSPPHFTWMDTNHPAATPRCGYPVEIQALWWAALRFAAEITGSREWADLSDHVRKNFQALFWDADREFLCDCRHARGAEVSAHAAAPDDALRPNQLFAVTLGLVEERFIAEKILAATEELLVPGALRSLAARPVKYALPVEHNGRLLNDPQNPYWPHYEGDEDTRRKPAYHNGTAWCWLFPSFCEAWHKCYGAGGRAAARSWLAGGVAYLLGRGCIGQLPEIVDGDAPHQLRGCDAQAWSIAEAYRVWKLLSATPADGCAANANSAVFKGASP